MICGGRQGFVAVRSRRGNTVWQGAPEVYRELVQGTAVCVRRANARAVLRRRGVAGVEAARVAHSAHSVLAAASA